MKKIKHIFILLLIVAALFPSCGSMEGAAKTVDEFYTQHATGRYEQMVHFFHPLFIEQFGEQEIIKILAAKQQLIGKQKKAKQLKKSFKANNGRTFVGLYYQCSGEKKDCFDYFFFEQVDGKFLIMGYYFNLDKDKLPKFEDNFK